jgi:hypothetical protein
VQEYRFGFESSMSEDLQELEEQLMLKKKKKNATRRMEQIIRLHTEGNRAKLDQARQRESRSRTQTSSSALSVSSKGSQRDVVYLG